jgi:putative transposase
VAENLLNREFTAAKPGEKMVSDITYIRTDEGWLYAAAVIDLYGQKVIGLSMGERMTKELVLKALDEVYMRSRGPKGALIHSDRGSQYCSHEYWKRIEKYGLVCSMSKKGNCWDNAPMESFWGKLKYECLRAGGSGRGKKPALLPPVWGPVSSLGERTCGFRENQPN